MTVSSGLRSGVRSGLRSGVDPASGAAPQTTLTVAITDSVDPVISSVNFTYACVVTNTGAVDATSVSAVVALDASLTYVSGVGTGWTVGVVGQTVTCTRALLAPGAAPTITITVTTAAAASTETTTANASAANAAAAPQDNETTVVKLVDRDATLGWRFPANATQWADFNAYHVAIATPDYPNVAPISDRGCQDLSAGITDSIGGVTLAQSGAGHLYDQTIAGVTRHGAKTTDGTTNQKWINSTSAPNPSLVSVAWLAVMAFPAAAPAATRCLMANSAALDCRLSVLGRIAIVNSGTTTGATSHLGGIHLVLVQHNITASTFTACTDLDKIIGGYAAVASNTIFVLGGQTAPPGDIGYLYQAGFTSAAAEFGLAGAKALIKALTGITPTWVP
jgi:uncharacterized repeat protein (TIGR01451 family)